MIDIDTYIKSLHLKWILKLQNNNEDNWTILPHFYFDKFGKNLLIFKMNLKNFQSLDKNLLKSTPDFYKELIKTWISVKGGATN